MKEAKDWTVSVISHRHGRSIVPTLESVASQLADRDYRIILTINVAERTDHLDLLPPGARSRLILKHATAPRSFAENHNLALLPAQSRYILALDPQLTFSGEAISDIERVLSDEKWGIVAPRAYTLGGEMEDNARKVVSLRTLAKRYLSGGRRTSDYWACESQEVVSVDWLAGLFMAARTETFRKVGGFDPRYRLYCEDVDLCLRITPWATRSAYYLA